MNGNYRRIKTAMHKFFRPFISKSANRFLSCSDLATKWMYPEKMQSKAVLLKNGVDISKFKFDEEMRKRNHVIPVRLNAKELRFLEEQVEKSGLSREEYIRSIVMGGEVRARPCEHHTELLRKISGLCNNANQLAHVANGCGMAGEESIREMLRMTKETWRLVKEEW